MLAIFCLSATAWTAATVHANQRPRIVVLHSGYPQLTPIHKLFEALKELGYEDGRNATIELLAAEGDAARLARFVADLAARKPDVIIAFTGPAVLEVKRAGLAIPIVFAIVTDPVAMGIVASLARPGANITGVALNDPLLGGKRLELLMDAVPQLRRVAVMWPSMHPEGLLTVDSVSTSASKHGIEIFGREMRGPDELAAAFGEASRAGSQAAIFITNNALFARRKEIAAIALQHRMPTIHAFQIEVEDGALMSYGADLGENYRRAAALAARILRGEKPADLPVEQPTRFTFAINLRTAAALGIALPPSLIARADEVIE